MDKIWLASFPRSGNTLLRTLLWQCFELRSASIYANDLGGNSRLEEYVGHLEHARDKLWAAQKNGLSLVKTHEHSSDDIPAIYVIRDGRAACASLYEFYESSRSSGPRNRRISLEDALAGRHWAGSWSDHVRSWNPWERPRTLVLRYEDMLDDLTATLDAISGFIERDIVNTTIPDRRMIAEIDGRWVRPARDGIRVADGDRMEAFCEQNREIMLKANYLPA